MGSLGSRPQPPTPPQLKIDWKDHATLQRAFELLTELIPGGISASLSDGVYYIKKGRNVGSGSDICSAILSLKNVLEKKEINQ